MTSKIARLHWVIILSALAVVLTGGTVVLGVNLATGVKSPTRSDIIKIYALRTYGALDFPPVEFHHDKHTAALKKQAKDCSACHQSKEGQLSFKFKRLKDGNRQMVMDTYHNGCIGCHEQNQKVGIKTGPVLCRQCHVSKDKAVSGRQPVGWDKSLHFRHSQNDAKTCQQCHHQYNKAVKKLVYVKGQEGTCRYCHIDKVEGKRGTLAQASHQKCLNCHLKEATTKKKSGPLDCAACHSLASQKKIKQLNKVARLMRGQPDVVLVKGFKKDGEARMNQVPFDHKSHEGYLPNCRTCHHASLNSCAECHTVLGDQKGMFIKLGQAFHQAKAEQSCLGCHQKQQASKDCAGCHRFMPQSRNNQETCLTCHLKPPAGWLPADPKVAARQLLAARPRVSGAYDLKEVPEKVVIKAIAKEYGPVTLPHRKIVATMLKGMKKSKLAQYFHRGPNTICAGCHHNSPASQKPPKCGSCHGRPFQPQRLLMPGLKATYHQQCMGCHQAMGLKKPADTACTECHKKK